VAGILFRDLIAGQFAPPALIDGARLHPQHDCEYKQGTGNGGSILSIFAHDEPPILSTREHARGLQWRRCSDASRKRCMTRFTQFRFSRQPYAQQSAGGSTTSISGMAHADANFECFEIARGSSFAAADAVERAWGGGKGRSAPRKRASSAAVVKPIACSRA